MNKAKLLETNDAEVWAKQFIRCKEENGWVLDDIDEGLMLAWFANAMAAQEFADREKSTEVDSVV